MGTLEAAVELEGKLGGVTLGEPGDRGGKILYDDWRPGFPTGTADDKGAIKVKDEAGVDVPYAKKPGDDVKVKPPKPKGQVV